MAARRRIGLAPLLGANGTRVADRVLGGTYMRGGYNVELRDGEWWTRPGETRLDGNSVRFGSVPWWWVFDVNRDLTVIANAWWALAITSTGSVEELYAPDVTENVDLTEDSATAASTTLRTVGQLVLVGSGDTNEVYRVTAASGTGPYSITLERPYEGSTGTKSCRFIDPLPRNTSGTATAYSLSSASDVQGSAVVFEQLVSHALNAIHAASPAVTAGNLLLVITSNHGVPVAIDLTAYLAGSPAAVKRTWFYNTALATPAQIGSDDYVDLIRARGLFAEVYKGRLFIAAASDPSGDFGSRTVWYSQPGDLLQWHTGISGQTAAPNFKTFDGEGNNIGEMKALQDELVIHRQDTQVVCSSTASLAQPFVFRENNQGIGVRTRGGLSFVLVVEGQHFLWTPQGLASFDGRSVRLLAREALRDWMALRFVQNRDPILHAQHDTTRRRTYWWSGSTIRHQDALPAAATVTNLAGDQYQNYIACFVYEYDTGAFWFEDRPYSLGGGTATSTSETSGPVLHLSRPDGTIVKAASGAGDATGQDAAHLDPGDLSDNVTVNAQVETGWLDFGSVYQKQLLDIETVERSVQTSSAVSAGGIFDSAGEGVSDGNWWLRCRVFVDFNRVTAAAGVGTVIDSTSARLTSVDGNNQAQTFNRSFTPRVHGRFFKLVFSNALTAAATTASYVQAPFRISDVYVEFKDRQSTRASADLSGASISE